MDRVRSSASSARLLIVQITTDGHPAHFSPVRADGWAVVDGAKEDARLPVPSEMLKGFHPYRVWLDFIGVPLNFQHWGIQGAER